MAFISSRQAAQRLGLSMQQMYLMRKAGQGPPWRRIGHRTVIYDEQGMEDWLREATRESGEEARLDYMTELRSKVLALALERGELTMTDVRDHFHKHVPPLDRRDAIEGLLSDGLLLVSSEKRGNREIVVYRPAGAAILDA